MIIGCPSEIKVKEYRVSLIPSAVKALVTDGHTVLVQSKAGLGSGISDAQYQAAGAEIVDAPQPIWERAQLICKVKEPVPNEFHLMRPGQIVFTFLHLAANLELTEALLKQKISCVAFETVHLAHTL